jgi:hypothetical protein
LANLLSECVFGDSDDGTRTACVRENGMLVVFGVDRCEVVGEGELTATEWLLELAKSSRDGGTNLWCSR